MDFFSFFQEYGSVIILFVSFLFNIIMFFRTGNKKYLKEVSAMIYRKENYQDTVLSENKDTGVITYLRDKQGQTFDKLKPVYRLNKVTGILEKTDELVDIQEIIDSSVSLCMNNILERFFPDVIKADDSVIESKDMQADLDFLCESFNVVEDYKQKFNLPLEWSASQVFDFIKTKKAEVDSQISKLNDIKEVVKNVEKENVEEGK